MARGSLRQLPLWYEVRDCPAAFVRRAMERPGELRPIRAKPPSPTTVQSPENGNLNQAIIPIESHSGRNVHRKRRHCLPSPSPHVPKIRIARISPRPNHPLRYGTFSRVGEILRFAGFFRSPRLCPPDFTDQTAVIHRTLPTTAESRYGLYRPHINSLSDSGDRLRVAPPDFTDHSLLSTGFCRLLNGLYRPDTPHPPDSTDQIPDSTDPTRFTHRTLPAIQICSPINF